MKKMCTYMALVLLLVIGCSTAKTYTSKEQREEREIRRKEARQQVEDAKTLQPE
jgi:uncharacterized protein YcfL